MFRKPAVWILFILFSIGGAVFSFQYFPKVFPIVELDIQMDRKSALDAARVIAQKHNLGPEEYNQSASFQTDTEVQYYVELEVGGSDAFQKMIREGLYSPYIWIVRHFKEGEVNESQIRFTPDGQPYGFSEWLSEDQPGASLSTEQAQKIAESEAKDSWNIDLDEYSLIEKSQETRPSGRVDHIFTYERPDHKIGEGRYRLSLEVSGDKLTEVNHYIKIPEEFYLRYQQMRSANETIADVASFIMYLLYLLGGGCFGLFFLMRKRWVIWRAPLFWGIFIALLQALAAINQWPGEWMYYDTALTAQVFVLDKIVDLITDFLLNTFILTVSFMAAESLTRKAFSGHIQLWRLALPGVANSNQVLGRTISGYLLVGLDLAFLIGLYFFSTNILGWWTPSDVLIDPNVLATYFPWFSPLADSLQAGFWEECLCRAIPIAGAALIGQKLGHRRLWIAGALIFQAIVFGAAHANYAGQPSYSRVVELIIPSLIYGWIYLRYGLLTGIILHFAYDAVLMALPLFVSSASGIWIDKIIVGAVVFVPLWVAIFRRLQNGKWSELNAQYFNRAWQPKENKKPVIEANITSEYTQISPKTIRWVAAGGMIGLVLWIFTANFQSDSPSLSIDRSQAQKIAQKALKDHGIDLPASWKISSSVGIPKGEDDYFIWQEEGKNTYKKLLGNYLYPPFWRVRFAQFEGDIAKRAEQYKVYITHDGKIIDVRHELPENKAGAIIGEEKARKIAHSVLKSKYHRDPLSLKEVSAESFKCPSRRDWIFIFSDNKNFPLKNGETRIGIEIAGDEVVLASRYVHVPEKWSRENQNRDTLIETIDDLCYYLVLVLASIPIFFAIIQWNRNQFSSRAFIIGMAILFSLALISKINNWPSIWAGFSTIEPIGNQILSEFTSSFNELFIVPFAFALLFGISHSEKKPKSRLHWAKAIIIGLSLGIALKGFYSLSSFLTTSLSPTWAHYFSADNYFPILGESLGSLMPFLKSSLVFLLVLISIDKLSKGWTCRKILSVTFMIIFWTAYLAVSGHNILLWLTRGLFTGSLLMVFYIFIFRFDRTMIPFTTATILSLNLLQDGIYNAYPQAIPGILTSIVLINLASYYWYKKLSFTGIKNDVFVDNKIKKSLDLKFTNVEKEKIQQIAFKEDRPTPS